MIPAGAGGSWIYSAAESEPECPETRVKLIRARESGVPDFEPMSRSTIHSRHRVSGPDVGLASLTPAAAKNGIYIGHGAIFFIEIDELHCMSFDEGAVRCLRDNDLTGQACDLLFEILAPLARQIRRFAES